MSILKISNWNESFAWGDHSLGGYLISSDLNNYLAKDNINEYTPTSDYEPATKKYVDKNSGGVFGDGVGNIESGSSGTIYIVSQNIDGGDTIATTNGIIDGNN